MRPRARRLWRRHSDAGLVLRAPEAPDTTRADAFGIPAAVIAGGASALFFSSANFKREATRGRK